MTNGEAINWIINISADIGKAEHSDLWHYEQALSEIREMLETAQPERPKGEWIHIRDEEDGNALYECSVCHKGEVHVPIVEVSYCWNCGADMRGEEHEQKH